MQGKTPLTYEGSKFPKWLAAVWGALLVWLIFYLIRYAVPNFVAWLESKPVDRFVQ